MISGTGSTTVAGRLRRGQDQDLRLDKKDIQFELPDDYDEFDADELAGEKLDEVTGTDEVETALGDALLVVYDLKAQGRTIQGMELLLIVDSLEKTD